MGATWRPEHGGGGEEAFVRLREVLGAPDRRGWRRYLPVARSRREPGVVPGAATEAPLAGREGPSTLAGVSRWLALPVLGAAVILLVSVFRAPATSPDARQEDLPARSSSALSVRPPATPPPTAAAPLPERVWPAEGLSIEGNVVRRGEEAWEVGERGDVVVLGDWDCDGSPTPGVLRPRDGGFFVFDRWAVEGEVVATRVAVSPGAVAAEAAGCGEVVLRDADGGAHEVATAAPGAGA